MDVDSLKRRRSERLSSPPTLNKLTLAVGVWLAIALGYAPIFAARPGGSGVPAISFMVILVVSFGIAAGIRGAYATGRNRRFWMPSLFVIASIVTVLAQIGTQVNTAASTTGLG
jgi:hypothetical protein